MGALVFQPEYYKSGTAIPMDGFSVASVIIEGKILGMQFHLGGIVIGTMELKEAGTKPGELVSGKLKGDVYQLSR